MFDSDGNLIEGMAMNENWSEHVINGGGGLCLDKDTFIIGGGGLCIHKDILYLVDFLGLFDDSQKILKFIQ